MSANDVSFVIGSSAIIAVYTPAAIASSMTFFHVRSVPPNSFFSLSIFIPLYNNAVAFIISY